MNEINRNLFEFDQFRYNYLGYCCTVRLLSDFHAFYRMKSRFKLSELKATTGVYAE